MTTLIQDFKNGIKLSFIGITGWVENITDIKAVANGYSISCDGGMYFTVSANKIHYSNNV